jgi:hypothetical protein
MACGQRGAYVCSGVDVSRDLQDTTKIWGWKEIAVALGRSEKQVRRYAKRLGPKRLQVSNTAGRVWTYTAWLDEWRAANTAAVGDGRAA